MDRTGRGCAINIDSNMSPTLKRWIENHDFPAGLMLGRNTRAGREDDIEAWLAARAEETV